MFDYQTPEGMIIDLIAFRKKKNNVVCSKPPIAGWAIYGLSTYQDSFHQKMLPKLLKYHEWNLCLEIMTKMDCVSMEVFNHRFIRDNGKWYGRCREVSWGEDAEKC